MAKKDYDSCDNLDMDEVESLDELEDDLETVEVEMEVLPNEPIDIVVTCEKLNLRSEPDLGDNVLAVLKKGDTLITEDLNYEWVFVYTESGMEGYVMKKFIKEV